MAVTGRKSKLLQSGLGSLSSLWVLGRMGRQRGRRWVAKSLQPMGRGAGPTSGWRWASSVGWAGQADCPLPVPQSQAYRDGGRARPTPRWAPPSSARVYGGKAALAPRFSWPQLPAAPRPCPFLSGPWCSVLPLRPGARASHRAAAPCLLLHGPPRTGHGGRASAAGCGARRPLAACTSPTPAPPRLPPPCVLSAHRTRSAAA